MRRISSLFLVSLILNLLWENAHAALYVHYQGGAITEYILLRAALVDAIIITVLVIPFLSVHTLRTRPWVLIPLGIVVSVLIEWWALGSGRWAYTAGMPIIPLLGVGLTPTIQLGILGYCAYKFTTSHQ